MKRHLFVLVGLASLMAFAPVADAQSQGFEITPTVGFRFSSSLSSGQTYDGYYIDSVNIPGKVSYGLSVEFPIQRELNVEAIWSRQASRIDVTGKPVVPGVGWSTTTVADLAVDTIQAGVLWQSGRTRDRVRGYFDVLFGATILSPSKSSVPMSTLTRFSASFGGGVKLYMNEHLGLRAGVRYMPVYINSKLSYTSCHPYWGCYGYYNTTYLHQVDASAGLILRF